MNLKIHNINLHSNLYNSVIMNLVVLIFIIGLLPVIAYSQEEPQTNVYGDDTLSAVKQILTKDTTYQNWIAGEFTPGRGFDISENKIWKFKHQRIRYG